MPWSALAVSAMGMTLEQALRAATVEGARALALQDEMGRLEVGKRCDLAVLSTRSELDLAYHFGVNLVAKTVAGGREIA